MKKALVSPMENAYQVKEWIKDGDSYTPVSERVGSRVAGVEETVFPVAEPLFWMDCADDVVQDRYFYDDTTKEIKPIEDAPYPVEPEPTE